MASAFDEFREASRRVASQVLDNHGFEGTAEQRNLAEEILVDHMCGIVCPGSTPQFFSAAPVASIPITMHNLETFVAPAESKPKRPGLFDWTNLI